MKQKLFTLLLAVAASIGTMLAWDYEHVKIGKLYYNLNATNTTAEVTYELLGDNFNYCDLTTANIPASVTYRGTTYSVTSIGNNAFLNCSAFAVYSGLTSVTIPNSVTSIGEYAFNGCSGLTSVTIPNSVTSIGEYAFWACSGLTSVTIPNSVTSIGDYAFNWCYSLTSLSVEAGNTVYDSRNNCNAIIETSTNTLIFGCQNTTIPNSVTSIGAWAFSGCSSLTSVTIGNSVTSIGAWAFDGCSSLTSVTIPNSVTSIGEDAFLDCTGLTSIYVPCGEMERFKQMLNNDRRVKYAPVPITINAENGSVTYPQTMCDDMSLNATPDYGYHFVKWSDGNTDNPRTFVLTQDTTFTAEFAKNTYTISTTSANPEWGTTAGDTAALYLDEVEISAIPNYGYHFLRWNDYNTSNPRTVSVTEDKTYTATFAKNVYSITKNAEHGTISGDSYAEYLDEVTLSVSSDYGYHFAQWSDGNTDNPRTITLTSDTTFTAQFAKNTYTISTTSANPEWGTTAGDTAALYLEEVEISAIPNYGYHFVRWNDYNTSNPRIVSVTEDKTYTATFAKNVYSITKNAEHGIISGNSSAEYLDEVTLTANPDYGYHFTQWSDGNKENPRTFVLTQDTTFNAEFAIDRNGTCGDDNALTWTYDAETKTLTITGNGTLNSNYTFGVEAPTQMQQLVVGNEVTAIGERAFYGMSTINHLIIGGSVATIGNYAFAECRNFDDITCFATIVPVINETTFANVGNKQYIYLFVPAERERAYHRDTYWGEFDIQVQQAEETTVTTNDVQVEPQDNAATFTWPTSNNVASYTIEITKDGVLFCTLTFNSNGQLTGIAFAPSRDGQAHAPAAVMTANGLQFTVTGLDSGTQYGYSVTAKDANDQTVATYSGEFTTTSEGEARGLEEISSSLQGGERGRLILHNGQIFILRGEKEYTLTGQEVK